MPNNILEVKIPSPGESITEVTLSKWMVNDGEYVENDKLIAEIESEKSTLPLYATGSGIITILIEAGSTTQVGQIACTIDTSAAEISKEVVTKALTEEKKVPVEKKIIEETKQEKVKVTPLAQKIMEENHLSIEDVLAGLRRIGKEEVEMVLTKTNNPVSKVLPNQKTQNSREKKIQKMSPLRKKLSERLVNVKNQTAMLTTFNELDMSAVMNLRNQYQNDFTNQFGIKLGFLSFFVKASSCALMQFPMINSSLDGEEIIQYNYTDIGIAVQSPKGLMVPVIRNVESKNVGEIEHSIKEYANKAKENRIAPAEMAEGTFTITNGGVFGSLLSTPIINPPQSAILGMHNIVDRPVAISGKVEIRPMMYVALSYDHRIIDGKDSVSFLVKIKEYIENPESMLFDGQNMSRKLLGLM